MATHHVRVTDTEMDAALLHAQQSRPAVSVRKVEYLVQPSDLYVLHLSDGSTRRILREDLQGLENALPQSLKKVEIDPDGLGIRWPELDVDHYVPALLNHLYGTRRWMASIGQRGGLVATAAKSEAARQNGRKGGRPRSKPVAGTAA